MPRRLGFNAGPAGKELGHIPKEGVMLVTIIIIVLAVIGLLALVGMLRSRA